MELSPIETAPETDEKILVFGDWQGEIDCEIVPHMRGFFVGKRLAPKFYAIVGTEYYSAYCHASHWTPLPDPPVTP